MAVLVEKERLPPIAIDYCRGVNHRHRRFFSSRPCSQSTPEDAEREVKAPRMRRRSFSHFPCLHDDSLTAFLPPAVGNQGVPGMAQVSFPHISQACKKPRSRGATAIYAGKENQKVRGVNVEVLRTRDVVEVPAVESTGERAGMSRGRLRRWPSSADIGMVTDGR